jgi:hypothetical protein
MKPKQSFRFISRNRILEQMGCDAHAFHELQLKLRFMQNFSAYMKTKKEVKKVFAVPPSLAWVSERLELSSQKVPT